MMTAIEAKEMTNNVEEMKNIQKDIEKACASGDYMIYVDTISSATRNKLVALGYDVQFWTRSYRIKWGN